MENSHQCYIEPLLRLLEFKVSTTISILRPKTSICAKLKRCTATTGKAIAKAIEDVYKDKRIEDENCSVYLADSFVFVKELKNNNVKVNRIFTDPPYNISKENNFQPCISEKGC